MRLRITFARRSRVHPGLWLMPETVELPRDGARAFLRDARRSPDYHVLRVRRCTDDRS